MQLFERVQMIIEVYCQGSQSRLAELLGVHQRTLNRNIKPEGQDQLWQFLERILELFPGVNRYWLFLDEGEMGGQAVQIQGELEMLRQRIADLEKIVQLQDKIIARTEQHVNSPLKEDRVAASSGIAARS